MGHYPLGKVQVLPRAMYSILFPPFDLNAAVVGALSVELEHAANK